MNDDDLCEMMALSRKMLRKKSRREILDAAYGRANLDDPSDLPAWFVEDEKKVAKKSALVTEQELQAEREKLEMMGRKLPKKVMEAKFRKKKKMINQLKKAKGEANEVLDNEGLSPFTKARSINRIYSKAVRKGQPKKQGIVVTRKYNSGAPNRKSGRKFKVVDSRMKKDLRAQKRIKKDIKRGKRK